MRQVLTNLIGNAVKFTEKGEVVIGVTQSETDKHHVLNFTIKDTGIGIPKEAQGKLFQAFMQADGSTTRKYGGTGLGLAISKQLVGLMHGKISFESKEGIGTRFSFTAQMEKQSVVAKKTVPENSALKGLRVLIVHGNAFHRSLLAHQTRGWQMITEECGDLNGAVEMIEGAANENKPYNLALIELQDVGGSRAFERLLKKQKELRKVLISVPGQLGEDQTARRLGAGACLTLPVREDQLFDSLAAVMSKKAARSAAIETVNNANGHSREKAKAKKPLSILVAEDHPINQSVAVRQLRKLGHTTYVVSGGIEALTALEERDYDIVLMDCQMPNLDGYQATRAIRRNEGVSKHTVVIAMTANAMAGDREKCIAAGMDDYITKPIIAGELDVMLRKWSWPSSEKDGEGLAGRPWPHAAEPVENSIPIDLDRLIDATGENGRVPTEFIDLYQTQMAGELEKLQNAIRTDSADDVKSIAHGSAGMNANCGMTAVVAPLLELERMGMSGQLTHAGEVANQVQLGFNEICSYLERMPERV